MRLLKNRKKIPVLLLLFVALGTSVFATLRQTNLLQYASTFSQLEAEAGIPAGNVQVITDNTTSGGKYVVLNSQLRGSGTDFYLDCNGNDNNNGLSEATPWKSLAKVNAALLSPGDAILFKRGCSWNGTLKALRDGSTTSPIIYSAYGTGSLPLIVGAFVPENGVYYAVKVEGSYQIIDHIEATLPTPDPSTWSEVGDPNCNSGKGWPKGWRVGFNLGGNHNTVQYSKASNGVAGVSLSDSSSYNKVLYSSLINNINLSIDTPYDPTQPSTQYDDSGAWGIAVHGNNHEIAYNYLSGNNAWCSYDFAHEGASIEPYLASNISVHHNISVNDTTFTEFGDNGTIHDDGHTFAYNKIIYTNTSHPEYTNYRSIGLEAFNLRGTNHKIVHNSVYYFSQPFGSKTGDIQGIVAGGSTNSVTDNIFWAPKGWVGTAVEQRNIFWSDSGIVDLSTHPLGQGSVKTNPLFTSTSGGNLHLQATSPAINKGQITGGVSDLDSFPVPDSSGIADIGAYEYH